MSRNDFCSNYLMHSFLAHHGILGQKWGIRRFQNDDGSLTDEGRRRYGRDSIARNIGRALTNSSLGQRLAVNLNKGYKADKKEIKGLYKNKRDEIKSRQTDVNKEETKEKLKSLKSDYKKTLGEARTTAANINYDWQNPKTNEAIQTQSLGRATIKSLLLGGAGSRGYEYAKGNGAGTGEAVIRGIFTELTTAATRGGASVADYVVGKSRANKAGGYPEKDRAERARIKEEKTKIKEAGKIAAKEVAKNQKAPLTSRQSINNAVERGLAENRAKKEAAIKNRVEYAKNTGKFDMEFLERQDRYVGENPTKAEMLKAYEKYLKEEQEGKHKWK